MNNMRPSDAERTISTPISVKGRRSSSVCLMDEDLPTVEQLLAEHYEHSNISTRLMQTANGENFSQLKDKVMNSRSPRECSSSAPTAGVTCSPPGIAPVAMMASFQHNHKISSNTSDSLSISTPEKTFPPDDTLARNEDDFDSAYDATPPNRSPLLESNQGGDSWGAGYEVQDPYILRDSTRTKRFSSSHYRQLNASEGHDSLPNPCGASEIDTPDAECSGRTKSQYRRKNISGLPSYHEHSMDEKDPTYSPRKTSTLNRIFKQSSGSSMNDLRATEHHDHHIQPPEGPAKLSGATVSEKAEQTGAIAAKSGDGDLIYGERNKPHMSTKRPRADQPSTPAGFFTSTLGTYVSPSHWSKQAAPTKTRRFWVSNACISCHREKVKCDGKQPCSRFENRNDCIYSHAADQGGLARGGLNIMPRPASVEDKGFPFSNHSYAERLIKDAQVEAAVEEASSFLAQEPSITEDHTKRSSPGPVNSNSPERDEGEGNTVQPQISHTRMTTPLQQTRYPSPRPSGEPMTRRTDAENIARDRPQLHETSDFPAQSKLESPTPPIVAAKPSCRISYFITSKHPKRSRKKWPNGTLQGKTIATLFDDVSASVHGIDIHEIVCMINTSEEITYPLTRDSVDDFEEMKADFGLAMKRDRRHGITQFRIELEINSEENMAGKMEEDSDDEVMIL